MINWWQCELPGEPVGMSWRRELRTAKAEEMRGITNLF
jgi:hypothetical protein